MAKSKDYEVTVTLQTGLRTTSKYDAVEQVVKLLPETIEWGPEGAVLPFIVGDVTARKIDWEKEPRR